MAELTTDQALAELARKLLDDSGRRSAETIAGRPTSNWCTACHGDGPLRPWPLPNGWGDVGERVCDACWLKLARGKVEARWTGRLLEVWSTHPVHGELLRGTIRAVGIEHHELRPVTRWRIADQDSVDLGEHLGDFADAEARLLAATAWADEIETDLSNEE